MVTQATEGMAETTADRRVDRFAGLLALVLGIAAILVFVAGLRYGPHLTEISLPDGLCGFAKGHFVYVGTREDGQCRFLAMTESHGWAGVELHRHSFRPMCASRGAVAGRGTPSPLAAIDT